jgi:hypothetical protein
MVPLLAKFQSQLTTTLRAGMLPEVHWPSSRPDSHCQVTEESANNMMSATARETRCRTGELETGPVKKMVAAREAIRPPQHHSMINFPRCHLDIFIRFRKASYKT